MRKMAISTWGIVVLALSPVFIITQIVVGQDKTALALAATILLVTGSAGV